MLLHNCIYVDRLHPTPNTTFSLLVHPHPRCTALLERVYIAHQYINSSLPILVSPYTSYRKLHFRTWNKFPMNLDLLSGIWIAMTFAWSSIAWICEEKSASPSPEKWAGGRISETKCEWGPIPALYSGHAISVKPWKIRLPRHSLGISIRSLVHAVIIKGTFQYCIIMKKSFPTF